MERTALWRRRIWLMPLVIGLLLCAFACYISAEDTEPSLMLEPSAATVTYGDDLTLTVTLQGVVLTEGDTVLFAVEGSELSLDPVPVSEDGTATLTLAHPAFAAEGKVTCRLSAGTQTITATYSGDSALTQTVSVTVTPRAVSLKDFSVADRVYDGTTVATATHGGLQGVLDGDTVSLLEGSCHFQRQLVSYDAQGAVIPQSVTVSGYALGNTHYYNYQLILPDDVTASIFPKDVHILGLEAVSRPYNGSLDIDLMGGTLDPKDIAEDDLSILGLAVITGRLTDPNAGLQPVTLNEIYLTGAAAGNYRVVIPELYVEIQPAKLTLSVEKITVNKGQRIPALTAAVEGFVNGERAEALEGFSLPDVVPGAVNTLNTALRSFTVSYVGGNATQNYEFDRDSYTAVTLEICSVEVDSSFYTVSVDDLSVWHNAVITVTPVGDWVGITTDATDSSLWLEEITFLDALVLDRQGECSVTFALRHTDGTVTEVKELLYKLDTVAPTGDVLWKGQSIVALGAPAYRYFSRSAISLCFTAADGERCSGVSGVEYALSQEGPFTEISAESVEVATAVGAYEIFYRVTDLAGNVTLLRTDGMVLYRDVAADDPALSYRRLSAADASLSLLLNGNVPSALYGADGTPLDAAAFTVDAAGLLTVKADYLATLAAGEHTLKLTVDPLGYPYAEGATNDAPTPLLLTLTVTRCTPTAESFSVSLPGGTVYDGLEKQVTVTAPDGMGEVTVYYMDANGNRLDVIKNAGTYVIKIDTTMGADYESIRELLLGSLTIAKMTPAAPQVTYSTVTGLLSGEIEGLVYSLDGIDYLSLPDCFLDIVTRACTLYFYLPGDGINTENSEIAEIVITRAKAPVAAAMPESLFAACDGKIFSTVAGLEYRHVDEKDWIAVEGSVITNLAPGVYEVRVAAAGTALESGAVTAVIAAAPEFIAAEKQATAGEQPTVTLRGDLTALSELLLTALNADPASDSPIRSLSAIDQRTTEVIGFFELSLQGRHNGALVLEIDVGEAYNGRTLTVYYENAEGGVESLSAPCENGRITLTVDALSPILVTAPMVTPYGIGSVAWIVVLAVLLALTVVTCVAIEITVRKRKKSKS